MIASDWVVGSVVVGDQGALVGCTDLPVPPDPTGQGEQPLRDPDPDAGQGAAAVPFQPKLALEGLEGALDPLADTAQRPNPAGLVRAVGRSSTAPYPATTCSNSRPANPLSPTRSNPGRSRPRSCSSRAATTSRSPSFGVARHQATGSPSGAASTYRRNPQK